MPHSGNTDGIVAQRGFDCWCPACVAATPDSLDDRHRVVGCVEAAKNKEFGQYHSCSVSRHDPQGVAARRTVAQSNGKLAASKIKVGMLVAWQDRLSETDDYTLGVAADSGD